MNTYRIYAKADKQPDAIWRYTVRKWGEPQAEKYIRGLHTHFQSLADQDKPWRRLPKNKLKTKKEVYFSRYEQHYIFFCELSERIPYIYA